MLTIFNQRTTVRYTIQFEEDSVPSEEAMNALLCRLDNAQPVYGKPEIVNIDTDRIEGTDQYPPEATIWVDFEMEEASQYLYGWCAGYLRRIVSEWLESLGLTAIEEE